MISNYSEDNTQKIWGYLLEKGLNNFAIAGLLGNMYEESRIRPNNLQNSYAKRMSMTDEDYTAAVDCGAYGIFITDSAGYGLCQWTSSGRKQNLYKLSKERGCSIGDLDLQLDYLWQELTTSYKSVLTALQDAKTVDEATRVVMLKFERPANQSEAAQLTRVGYAEEFYTKYATEVLDMKAKVQEIMESYVGYLEKASNSNLESKTANAGNKNYTIFAKLYKDYTGENYQGQAWCAMFVSTCFVLAAGLEKAKELLGGKLYSYCPYGMKAFSNKGQLHTTPKAGDIVFFIKNGVAKHTGFVYKVSGNTFYTIEGNTSGASGVVANGGGVCKKSYTVNSNMRFGRPNYGAQKAEKEAETSVGKKYTGTFPVLPDRGYYKNGDGIRTLTNYTTQIKRLQKFLNWAIGAGLTVDGDFGNKTEAAVKAYQKQYGLTVDGEFGSKSLAKAKTIKK